MKKKYYVAYGSNLNISQMSRRCPTAIIYGKGVLKNWTLTFRAMRGPAYATIEKNNDSAVPVAVWEIDRRSEEALDRYEGFPYFYYKENVVVEMEDGDTIRGMAYIMNHCAIPGIPSYSYVRTIQEGYLDNNLDMKYLDKSLHMKRTSSI